MFAWNVLIINQLLVNNVFGEKYCRHYTHLHTDTTHGTLKTYV